MNVVLLVQFVTALQRRRRGDEALVDDLINREVITDGLLPLGEPEVTWRALRVDPARGMHLSSDGDEDGPDVAGWQLAVTTAAIPIFDRED